jgi:UDP-4-amino-4,6-dideoxy-N-acetyl-beta-L-altrosamine transaminase
MEINYGQHFLSEDDITAVSEALRSPFLTQGPLVFEFEKKFSEYIGSRYAVAINNGTSALHLCALALGIEKGIRVITSPITFVASANCVKYCGGEVWFADINPDNNILDINKVRELLESKPKGYFHGIIPVDFAGHAVDMEAFRSLADEFGLWLIEDACHAPGGFFIDSNSEKQNCGNGKYADLSIFSFHPVKHIACGEGGMITTNNEKLYNKLLLLRTHGITKDPSLLVENDGGWYYEMQELGYNYRLTEFQAALGISQLKRAREGIERRRYIAELYNQAFQNKDFILSHSGKIEGHAYHLYIIRVPQRKELYNYLKTKGIFCQIHYIPVYRMPYYKKYRYDEVKFEQAELYYDQCLSLPMYPTLTYEEQVFVINNVKLFYSGKLY